MKKKSKLVDIELNNFRKEKFIRNDPLINIFSYCSAKMLTKLMLVNKRYCKTARDKKLWESKLPELLCEESIDQTKISFFQGDKNQTELFPDCTNVRTLFNAVWTHTFIFEIENFKISNDAFPCDTTKHHEVLKQLFKLKKQAETSDKGDLSESFHLRTSAFSFNYEAGYKISFGGKSQNQTTILVAELRLFSEFLLTLARRYTMQAATARRYIMHPATQSYTAEMIVKDIWQLAPHVIEFAINGQFAKKNLFKKHSSLLSFRWKTFNKEEKLNRNPKQLKDASKTRALKFFTAHSIVKNGKDLSGKHLDIDKTRKKITKMSKNPFFSFLH